MPDLVFGRVLAATANPVVKCPEQLANQGGICLPPANIPMEITAALQPDDLAELDRVCRDQGVSRDDAVEAALRWYIDREGDLPSVDELDEIEP